MILFYALIFILVSILVFIKLSKKYKILLNYTGDSHQKFTSFEKTPLIGGCIFLLFIFLFTDFTYLMKLYLMVIFTIGILSDLKLLKSPNKRLILQFLIIIIFLYLLDIKLIFTKFLILDYLLQNIFFSFFFTAFCLLIVINGTNFIDGNNLVVLGYYLILLLIILFFNKHDFQTISKLNIFLLIELISILLIFNFLNKIYLGDNGALLIGSFFGIILVKFYLENTLKISSFFIVLILWYPAFENLFSIIRKFYFSKSPTEPDNNHLHQLLYFFLLKKFKFSKIFINNSVGLLITLYNSIIVCLAVNYANHTQLMVSLIFFNIVVYITTYMFLINYKKK